MSTDAQSEITNVQLICIKPHDANDYAHIQAMVDLHKLSFTDLSAKFNLKSKRPVIPLDKAIKHGLRRIVPSK